MAKLNYKYDVALSNPQYVGEQTISYINDITPLAIVFLIFYCKTKHERATQRRPELEETC